MSFKKNRKPFMSWNLEIIARLLPFVQEHLEAVWMEPGYRNVSINVCIGQRYWKTQKGSILMNTLL